MIVGPPGLADVKTVRPRAGSRVGVLRWIAVFSERIPENMRTVKLWLAFGAAFLFVFFGVHPGGTSGVDGARNSDTVSRIPPGQRDPISASRKTGVVQEDGTLRHAGLDAAAGKIR